MSKKENICIICKAQGRPLNARAERIIIKITRESESNG